MSNEIVPASVRLAAKRAFVRTTAQAYAAAIPSGGITAAVLLPLIQDPQPLPIIATVVATVASPLLAGLASYLSITSKGIPDEYQEAGKITG